MNLVDRNKNNTAAMVLIAVGVLALLGTLGVFKFVGSILGALLFGGLAYFAYVEGRRRGSAAWHLAAYPLAGLAIASIAPWRLGSGAFLAALGLAFAVYWREDRTRWWALIPAGTLASLGLVSFFEAVFGPSSGWLFLAGLALTFYALTRLEVDPQPWAIWPAAGLGLIALLSIVDGGSWIFPLALVAVGAYLLLRSGSGRDLLKDVTSRYGEPRQAAGTGANGPVVTAQDGAATTQQQAPPAVTTPPERPAAAMPPAEADGTPTPPRPGVGDDSD